VRAGLQLHEKGRAVGHGAPAPLVGGVPAVEPFSLAVAKA
jgi:hypothetical protein